MAGQTPKSERTRRTLLTAARQELIETGELRMADVATRAGVSEGLPFNHFGSRTGLLVAVLEEFHTRLDDAVIYQRFQGETWEARERQRVSAWIAFLYDDPLARVILTGLTGDADVARSGDEQLRRAIAVGARNMSAGQAAGDLPAGRDPEFMAAAALGAVHSIVRVALSRDPPPDQPTVFDECWAAVAGSVGLA